MLRLLSLRAIDLCWCLGFVCLYRLVEPSAQDHESRQISGIVFHERGLPREPWHEAPRLNPCGQSQSLAFRIALHPNWSCHQLLFPLLCTLVFPSVESNQRMKAPTTTTPVPFNHRTGTDNMPEQLTDGTVQSHTCTMSSSCTALACSVSGIPEHGIA